MIGDSSTLSAGTPSMQSYWTTLKGKILILGMGVPVRVS